MFDVIGFDRGLVGLGGLLYLLAVAVGMVVLLGAMWLLGRRFDPISRWVGPAARRFRGKGGGRGGADRRYARKVARVEPGYPSGRPGGPAPREERAVDEVMYGVFFEDQGVSEYLVAVYEDEEVAIEAARRFDEEMDNEEAPEPRWEDFDGVPYVEVIDRSVADEAREQLERGFAVKMSG
jgi:hypothetical protein